MSALRFRSWQLFAVLSLSALSGCVADRARLGEIRLRPYGNLTAHLSSFSVQEGRILSPDLDLTVEPDGCIRGLVGHNPLQICQKGEDAPNPERAGASKVQHWQGLGGDFVVELEEHGTRLRADGYLAPGGGLGSPLQATLPMGTGPQWDELRKHPALLAVAAAVAGVRGEPDTDAVERFTR
jgi:hypothetical protein